MTQNVWNYISSRCPPLLQRIWREDRGANMVIVALGLVALLSLGGVAVDGSNAYYQQQRMQIAADAAALGGARALANGQDTVGVDAAIRNLAQTNGAESVSWEFINGRRGVHVDTGRNVPTWFTVIFGLMEIPVSGASEAQFEPITGIGNLFPMTFSCNCINGGESTFIDPPAEEETTGGGCPLMPIALDKQTLENATIGDHLEDIYNGTQPGNFGWLSWTGDTSATSLHESLTIPGTSDQYINPDTGEAGFVVPGVNVMGLTGVDNSSSVRDDLDILMTTDILVPVWDTAHDTGSNAYYHIVGFAKVRLTGYSLSSGWISARFLGMANGCEEFRAGLATVNLGDGDTSRYDITFVEKVGDTWTYHVRKLWGNDLDWWALDLPACDGKFVSTESAAYAGSQLKWTLPAGFTEGTFTFQLDNDYVTGPVPVSVGAGGSTTTAELTGPDCNLSTDGVDTSGDAGTGTSLSVCLPPLDFETDDSGGSLVSGQIIDNEWAAWGVHVTTSDPANHPAMVFDSASPTGGDSDLGTPNQDFSGPGVGAGGGLNQPGENGLALGKVLVLSEDNDPDDPDDNGGGGQMVFTFDVGVRMDDVYIVDVDDYEATGMVRAYSDLSGGNLLVENRMLGLGENSVQAVPVNASGVRRLEIEFPGSGGIPAVVSCRNQQLTLYRIGDFIWDDADGDGIQDENEPGISGVELELYLGGRNDLVAKTTTNSRGGYRFENLPAGTYDVKIAASNFATGGPLQDAVLTSYDVGEDTLDSNFNGSNMTAQATVPLNGGDDMTIDGGFLLTGGGTAAPDRVTVDLNDSKNSQYEIRLVSQTGRTWTYRVREVSGSNLDGWSLGIENCLDHIEGFSPSGALVGPHGLTGFPGIGWDLGSQFDDGVFSFTLDGDYALGAAAAQLMVKNRPAYSTIAAPDCSVIDYVIPDGGGSDDNGGAGSDDSSDTCNFRWLDWDGTTGTNIELAENMNDTRRSGSWSVGRVISPGPALSNSTLVASALHNKIGDEFVIPLTEWTGEGYQVCGFAQVRLLDFDLGTDPIQMSIQFLKGMARSGDTDPLAIDYGARDVIMID